MGRVTMSEQLAIANDKIERLVDEKNLLVVEANKRIQEAADQGVTNLARAEAEYEEQYNLLKKEIEALNKKLADKESSYKYLNDSRNELQTQIAALQDILDVVPGVIPRRGEKDYGDKSVIIRFASILASKFTQ